jgi:hypothetical protein
MLNINGKTYVQGTIDITSAALARLLQMGVEPPKNYYPNGGSFDSFYLPEGEDGAEFNHVGGNAYSQGHLSLKGETL